MLRVKMLLKTHLASLTVFSAYLFGGAMPARAVVQEVLSLQSWNDRITQGDKLYEKIRQESQQTLNRARHCFENEISNEAFQKTEANLRNYREYLTQKLFRLRAERAKIRMSYWRGLGSLLADSLRLKYRSEKLKYPAIHELLQDPAFLSLLQRNILQEFEADLDQVVSEAFQH